MENLDIVKILAILLTIISLLLGYLIYISITLPNNIDKMINTRLSDIKLMFDKTLSTRLELIELLFDEIYDSNKDESNRIYAMRQAFRLSSKLSNDRLIALRALLGFGKDASFLIPYIEHIRQENNWSKEEEYEYKVFLNRLRKK